MPSPKPAKKPNSGAPDVKLLITAASLAATLGGWALISAAEAKPASASLPDQVTASTTIPIQAEPHVAPIVVQLAPLPTLVPASARTQSNPINQPRPAARAAQAAPQTAPQPATNGMVLRDVSAPTLPGRSASVAGGSASAPAPVVNTGSSR